MIIDQKGDVGTARIVGPKKWGTYTGPRDELRGKTCIMFDVDASHVGCQFDDTATGYGYGWHEFPRDHLTERECGGGLGE